MAIIVKQECVDFESVPVGTHGAVCVGVFDIGTQRGQYQGKPTLTHQIIVAFEIDELITRGEYAGKRFMMSKWYTLSLHEKANLRKDLESWRSKPFSESELAGFDVEKVIGVPCLLTIAATENDKRKITAISPLPKGMIAITQSEPLTQKYLDFIAAQRNKSVEAGGSPHAIMSATDDDLPF